MKKERKKERKRKVKEKKILQQIDVNKLKIYFKNKIKMDKMSNNL